MEIQTSCAIKPDRQQHHESIHSGTNQLTQWTLFRGQRSSAKAQTNLDAFEDLPPPPPPPPQHSRTATTRERKLDEWRLPWSTSKSAILRSKNLTMYIAQNTQVNLLTCLERCGKPEQWRNSFQKILFKGKEYFKIAGTNRARHEARETWR